MAGQGFNTIAKAVRDYTGGLGARDVHTQLGRDASRAWEVLTRDHAQMTEPKGFFPRVWHRTRILFLGLTSRLSPPRRVVFIVCLVLAVVGIYQDQVGTPELAVPSAPLIVISFVGLVFLLALELADRVLVRDELEVARELQRGLLPLSAPEIEGFEFVFSYRTANTIGGDYYDFLPLADGRVALVIGDASGHGMAAGLLMAIANATIKLAMDLDPRPDAVATMLNLALVRTGDRRAFMTLFYGLLDPSSGKLDYVCCGHPYPLLRHASGDIVELGEGSLPLGLRLEVELPAGSVTVQPDDLLLMYTDGIPEAVRGDGTAFGFERVRDLLESGGEPRSVHDRVVAELDRFTDGEAAHDDRSLVVMGRAGEALNVER